MSPDAWCFARLGVDVAFVSTTRTQRKFTYISTKHETKQMRDYSSTCEVLEGWLSIPQSENANKFA